MYVMGEVALRRPRTTPLLNPRVHGTGLCYDASVSRLLTAIGAVVDIDDTGVH